jgi:hypothetical protein
MDTLLKEMRSAMFNLRVALQSFEDFEILPLSETTYVINQLQMKLQECSQNAQGNIFSFLYILIVLYAYLLLFLYPR